MTTEEKAKAYDKAVEKIKYVLEHGVSPTLNKEDLQDIFSELKESEDERVRKEIVQLISCMNNADHRKERWLAWLEKQGEQKPADKVEPKFHKGDWCIDNEDGTIFQIVKVLNDTYTYKTNEGKEYSCTHYSLETDAKLWIIEDAKDGDVLLNKHNQPFIYNGIFDEKSVGAYCGIVCDGSMFIETNSVCQWANNIGIKPATKEQRDLLFRKMQEAGYEWNVNKKELMRFDKKVEQEPVDNIATKFKVGDWITDGQLTCKVLGITDKSYVLHLHNDDYSHFETDIQSVNKFYHLWTIADTKDGDVLYSLDSNQPFIYKCRNNSEQATCYCGINKFGKFFIWNTKDCIITLDKYVPATLEQRDLLFSKMKEAYYEWDSEEKELRKIESQVEGIDWLNIVDAACDECYINAYASGEYCHHQSFKWGFQEGVKWMEEQGEKESKWTEEDSLMIDSIIDTMIRLKGKGATSMNDWLESLKQRMEEQQ